MSFNIWENLIIQERARKTLEKIYNKNFYTGAFIFYGKQGVGKEAHALAFAQSLNCLENSFTPCGTCENCKKIYNFIEPFIYLVYPTPTTSTHQEQIEKKVKVILEKKKSIPI